LMNEMDKTTGPDQRRIIESNKAQETQSMQQVRTAKEGEQIIVPLVEEYLNVNKEWVQSGEVVVRKTVQTTTQTIPVNVAYEEVQVDHVPVNRALAHREKTEPWWDGDVMVIPVIEEEIVVMKRQVLKEELRVHKRRLVRQENVSDTVRSEQIQIEATGSLRPVDEGEQRG